MVGAGAARKPVFSDTGNPGVGSLHRLRDAVEHGWPGPLELEEHSHAAMANRFAAGASGLPCALMRGYIGTDLEQHTRVARVTCPFTGSQLDGELAETADAVASVSEMFNYWIGPGRIRVAFLGAAQVDPSCQPQQHRDRRLPNTPVRACPAWAVRRRSPSVVRM